MSKTIIPAQIRVTFQELSCIKVLDDGTRIFEEYPLAFAIAYEPTKKDWGPAKHRVQDEWAYKPWQGTLSYIDGVLHLAKVEYDYKVQPSRRIEHPPMPIEEARQPRIIDNVPTSGFKIVDFVTRYSTSNKLWEILDPRGFRLQISTQNLEEIIMGGVIDKGLIHGEFVWQPGRTVKLVRI